MMLVIRLLVALMILFNPLFALAQDDSHYELLPAKVIELDNTELSKSGKPLEQFVTLEILEGERKGEKVLAHNLVPDNQAYSIIAKEGHKYMLALDASDIYISDYYREPVIYLLLGLFFLLLILFGGVHGFKAIIALGVIALTVFYLLLPWISSGFNPILAAIIVAAIATAVTMLLVAGWSRKALAATLGTTGGVTVAGVLAILVIKFAPLSGLASPEARILLGNMDALGGVAFDFQGILAAGILISSLGAAMDVAISIASAAQEIHLSNHNQSKAELFTHSMNVGRDIMGTMTNTLVLAYAGSAIPLLLLLSQEPLTKTLNMEVIVTELTAAIIGSIGLLLAIPITAFMATFLLKIQKPADCQA